MASEPSVQRARKRNQAGFGIALIHGKSFMPPEAARTRAKTLGSDCLRPAGG